jgi:hypothetical protein
MRSFDIFGITVAQSHGLNEAFLFANNCSLDPELN